MRKDAVKRCVGKRQGSPHTADNAAWVKSWNMTVSFPAFQTHCAGRRISFRVLVCVVHASRQPDHPRRPERLFRTNLAASSLLIHDLAEICLLVVSHTRPSPNLNQIVCHMDFKPVW